MLMLSAGKVLLTSLCILRIARALAGEAGEAAGMGSTRRALGGAIGLGGLLALLMAWRTGRIQRGGRSSSAPPRICRWTGPAVLAQTGVVVGLGLVGARAFPRLANLIPQTVFGSTVVFEPIRPVGTHLALGWSREMPS
jgi:hypothetical protein